MTTKISQVTPFQPAVYEYHINLDERGEFYADVRNVNGKTVFEIKGFDVFEDGWMDDKHDIQGLREYLISLGIMKTDQRLRDAENNRYAEGKYALRKLATRSMGRQPLENIFQTQSKSLAEPQAQTDLDDFALKALNAGYNKDEIVDGITRYFRQSREVASNIVDKMMKEMKLMANMENKMTKTAMMEWMELGPTPPEEDCAQVGQPDYREKAIPECRRYIDVIRKKLGPEPPGAQLKIKSNPHDFGTYYDVGCYYDEDNKEAMEYAFKCESEGPMTWKG